MQSWSHPRSVVAALIAVGLLTVATPGANAQSAATPSPRWPPRSSPRSRAARASAHHHHERHRRRLELHVPRPYQEDRGVVAPAFLDMRIPLFAGRGGVSAVRANVGMWNSFHSGPTGAQGRSSAWCEADYYASLTATAGRWSPARSSRW
jgi:hypothetical protein